MSVPTFSYAFAPPSLLVSQTQQLTLTISNPCAQPVTCGTDLTITVTLPVGDGATDLVTADGATGVTAAPQEPNWTQNVDCNEQSVTIQIFPARSATLAAGAQLDVAITGIAVNAVVSSPGASLGVQASNRSGDAPMQSFSVAKVAAGMSISAYADPISVGQGSATSIYWSATGGSHVQLSLDGTVLQDVPLQGAGPTWSGKFSQVKPYPGTPQTTYAVTVLDTTGANQRATSVVLGLASPSISYFRASKQQGLGVHESVDLTWDTADGPAAYLTPSSGPGSLPVNLQDDAFAVVPGSWIPGAPNASSVDATLSVTGYLGPTSRPLTFAFAPAAIVYFSYASMSPSDGVARPVVFNGAAQMTSNADGWTLRVVGPGGPLVRSIGGAGPTVNYFGPAAPTLAAPGTVTFDFWVVGMNAGDTLTLNGQAVSVDATGKGSQVVSVASTTAYTLHAVLSGQTVDNTVTVTVTSKESP